MTTVVSTHPADARPRLSLPRDDNFVLERADGDGRFTAVEGPFRHYERQLSDLPDGEVEERIDFRLAIPGWWPLFVLPIKFALARPHRFASERAPWWAFLPPARFDARASTVLALLGGVSLVAGYLGTIITQ
ncbi:MAG: hypothetical protein ACRD0G_15425, partial [Acidimicrobiales bacterium]